MTRALLASSLAALLALVGCDDDTNCPSSAGHSAFYLKVSVSGEPLPADLVVTMFTPEDKIVRALASLAEYDVCRVYSADAGAGSGEQLACQWGDEGLGWFEVTASGYQPASGSLYAPAGECHAISDKADVTLQPL